jgi:pseudaminic acid biosynthesis-associated methylase
MESYETEQEEFWAGEFGNDYVDRNAGEVSVAGNLAFFGNILARTRGVNSVLELGANRGLNLIALRSLLPKASFVGVDINTKALELMRKIPNVEGIHSSILDFDAKGRQWDFALIKGVMIHINPEYLTQVYDTLYRCSSRYICIAEYYNPSPVEVTYRGHQSRLFKRDFAGEVLDRFSDLRLVDYGFSYRRDPVFPQDDINWFLLEKSGLLSAL